MGVENVGQGKLDLHMEEVLCKLAHPDPLVVSKDTAEKMEDMDKFSMTRLSKNFIMRDFLYSARGDVLGITNYPQDDVDQVIRSGKALCEKVLEPVRAEFGGFSIIYGYQNRTLIEAGYKKCAKHSSSPHHWDRGTFHKKIYARVDILPYCVEDGEVSRFDFGRWMMFNLDIDLLMQWEKSNVYCITIAPRPRRVWLEWVKSGTGHNGSNCKTIMGEHYWQDIYPQRPQDRRPKFAPSCTGGSMRW